MQVGNAFNQTKTERELKLIASDPSETHAFKVTNYAALDGLLNQLQQSIIRMEGEGFRGPSHPVAAPSAFHRKPKPCAPALPLSYCHAALWATPVTNLTLSCSISNKATISPALLTSSNFHEALIN